MSFDNLNNRETVTPKINDLIVELDRLYWTLNNSNFQKEYKAIQNEDVASMKLMQRIDYLDRVLKLRDKILDFKESNSEVDIKKSSSKISDAIPDFAFSFSVSVGNSFSLLPFNIVFHCVNINYSIKYLCKVAVYWKAVLLDL